MLSRRISAADGSFLGVVAGSVRFSYFHQLLDRLNLGPDDTIGVFRRDGTLIMRRPFDLDKIGKNLGQSPIIKRMLSEPSGSESNRVRSTGSQSSMYGAMRQDRWRYWSESRGMTSMRCGASRRSGSAPSC